MLHVCLFDKKLKLNYYDVDQSCILQSPFDIYPM